MNTVRIEPLGDCALLVRYGDRIDAETNALALTLADIIRSAGLPGIRDVAPAYASVCVRYDPMAWTDPSGARSPYACIVSRLRTLVENVHPRRESIVSAIMEIPVCYGGDFGPDLAALAAQARITTDEVITRHCTGDYRVAMLGFAPGFPYLLGLDPVLHMSRRASPRLRVPAGSVAIGGAQTGIYPRELPGGWQLIGRTPLRLFDPARASPALLAAGQRLRFRAIGANEFARLWT